MTKGWATLNFLTFCPYRQKVFIIGAKKGLEITESHKRPQIIQAQICAPCWVMQ